MAAQRIHLKDTTPDSGVVADNINSNSNSNQSTSSSHQKLHHSSSGKVVDSSQNSLLSSSSSTAAEASAPIWQQRNGLQAPSTQHQGKEYSRLEAPLTGPDTLFSSEASSSNSSENGEEMTDKPSFRWDGTPLVDKSKESKLVKKVKSLDQAENNALSRQKSINDHSDSPPIPPVRDSSVKREEIK